MLQLGAKNTVLQSAGGSRRDSQSAPMSTLAAAAALASCRQAAPVARRGKGPGTSMGARLRASLLLAVCTAAPRARAALHPSGNASCQGFTTRAGFDMVDHRGAWALAADAVPACCALCAENSRCNAWTFSPPKNCSLSTVAAAVQRSAPKKIYLNTLISS